MEYILSLLIAAALAVYLLVRFAAPRKVLMRKA